MDHEEARLKHHVDAYLTGCDEQDAKDHPAFGPDHDGSGLPEELRDAQARNRCRMRQDGHAPQRRGDAKPKARDPIDVTDPKSRIMVRNAAFVQAFDAPIAVDAGRLIVLTAQVGNDAPDVNDLASVRGDVMETTGDDPGVVTVDGGCDRETSIEHVTRLDAEAWISPTEIRRGREEWRTRQASRGRIANSSRQDRMRMRLALHEDVRLYRQRRASIEPGFGTAEECTGGSGDSCTEAWRSIHRATARNEPYE